MVTVIIFLLFEMLSGAQAFGADFDSAAHG